MKRKHEIFLEKVLSRRRFGIKPGLETISALMDAMEHPEREMKFVHVAGTNGKGATCAIIESVLHQAGMKTGRYTSPHLISLNERFAINTRPVDDGMLSAAACEAIDAIEKLEAATKAETTFFECLTAIAFALFKMAEVDVVVLETGLGGKFDATNVIPPESLLCAIVTRIGLDHCDWLGNTLADIAREKAGIIKEGRPVVLGEIAAGAREEILAIAKEKNAIVEFASRDAAIPGSFSLHGEFQQENARTALTALDVLKKAHSFPVTPEAIEKGLASVVWPGRCQHVRRNGRLFVVDGAHNADAAAALSVALSDVPKPIAMIAGFCGDKDVDAHLRTMSKTVSKAWAIKTRNERSLEAEELASKMEDAEIRAEVAQSLGEAIAKAEAWMDETNGTAVICGSLFLAGEALVLLDAFAWESARVDENEKTVRACR